MGSPCSPVAGWLLLVWKRGSPVWMGVGPSLPAVSGQRLIYSGKQPHTHYFQNKHAMLGFNFTPKACVRVLMRKFSLCIFT